MAKASSVSVTVNLDAIPVLPGALQCVSMGILSSLHTSNFRQKRAVANHVDAAKHKHYPLLFDPQTAGGLVAGVPPQYAQATLQKLVEAGYASAAIVGEVTASVREEAVDRVQCVWGQ
jgi:selenide,water dikinase